MFLFLTLKLFLTELFLFLATRVSVELKRNKEVDFHVLTSVQSPPTFVCPLFFTLATIDSQEPQKVLMKIVLIKAPKDRFLKGKSPKERSPKESSPKERRPKESSLKESSPKERSPKERRPKDRSPKESSP